MTSPRTPLPQREGGKKTNWKESCNVKYSSGMIRLQRIGENKLADSRKLRKNPTQLEDILWNSLRNRKCGGFKFRRQQVIDGFIVDFYCEKAKLVIEADGGIHETSEQKLIDEHRERVFQLHGIATIRFQNEMIINNLSNVLKTIALFCQQREKENSLSSPLLSGEGQGVRS
jgi:very-short-patch-repair endonuclease